jgi:hypothetical protein
MKAITFIFILLLINKIAFSGFCSNFPEVSEKKFDHQIYNDTLLKKGNYIVIGDENWKIDLLGNNDRKITSKGDTLFYNYDTFNSCLLLGDSSYQKDIQLFKKYSPKYNFNQFKVDKVFNGPFVKPDFNTNPKWKFYKTRIIEGAKGKPNFAGHYWICGWRCGSNCQTFVIVDCITGKIYDGLDDFEIEENKISNLWECHPNSKMLIINNGSLEKGKYYDLLGDCFFCGNTEVYSWEKEKFTRIE